VRGRRLRRLGGPAGEAGFAPEPLPRWARDACAAAAASDPSSSRLVPNHVLVNSYDFSKESYVLPHTDGPAYDDRTFTLSCGADAVVVFKERLKTSEVGVRAAATRCEVLLRRRSLLAFSREAYTECTHEIGAAPDTIGLCCVNLDAANARVGDVVGRAGERVSFTLRCASGAE
jgi:alkylated DNA repair protein alkB family protein 6